jgi:ribosomal protein S18 acetylase RimI-like enzyme
VPVTIRRAQPDDFAVISDVIDAWWGRPVGSSLPRLFLNHFHTTSFVAEDGGLAGFLIGFHSPSIRDVSYVHFIGIRPDCRRTGLARMLYELFIGQARAYGRTELRAITSPTNIDSVRFHERLGFTVAGPEPDYNGPDKPMITFVKRLG